MLLETDVAVIGGGLVGISVAYGLAQRKVDSVVVDEGYGAIRASRGNFGLVWVQGKGLALPAYTGWAMQAVGHWPDLAARLLSETGIDVGLTQKGGLYLSRSPEAFAQRARDLATVKSRFPGDYHFDMLDNAEIRKRVPHIGPEVVGGSYSPYDGQANPLRLLHALHRAYLQRGGRVLSTGGVSDIAVKDGKYILETAAGQVVARRIALAAGLGNAHLGAMLGAEIPVKPVRGRILVTERMPPMFDIAIEQVRQTEDGTLMIGSSWEEVGLDVATTFDVTRRIADDALHFFPALKAVRVMRSWAALRIITPDAAPIYEEVAPGAFLVTCHSGVSLAAVHMRDTAGWIAEGAIPAAMSDFDRRRFLL